MSRKMNFSNFPVIIEESLVDGELYELLKSQKFKIRASSKTPFHSCIFPMSSVVCTVEYFSNIVIKKECISIAEGFLKGLDKSLALHYKQYVFLLAPLLGSEELLILTELQERYLKTSLQFLPVHNVNECLTGITSIIKVNCQPTNNLVKERCKMAMERQISEETVMCILKRTGLTDHEVTVAIDGCGSLQSVAMSDVQVITDHTSLERQRSLQLIEFLSKHVFK